MANDSTQTVVPSSATLWIAPTGTTAPTNVTTAMGTVAAAWKDVGLIAEDGLAFGEDKQNFDVRAFGISAPVREGIRSKVNSLTVQLLQHNTLNFQTVYGGGTVTITSGTAKFTPPSDKLLTPVMACLEYADGTGYIERLVIPSCSARDGVQRVFPNDGAVVLPLTLTALGGTAGVAPWYELSNNTTAFTAS